MGVAVISVAHPDIMFADCAMPLTINDFPAAPECGGTQWTVANQDQLALLGTVLVGRAQFSRRGI